ncbi:MAG: hypothetical protein KJ052_16995 [Candidatus Hydrogenedentes bacterium]|nr:hypothetical protein [Candidatus Hydrogenedentota bacterium]
MSDKELEAVRLIQTQLDKYGQMLAILTRRGSDDCREALRDADYFVRAAIRALADVDDVDDVDG